MAKIDWKRTRKFKESEEKYTPGKVLTSGRVVRDAPRDSLDARARAAEKEWQKKLKSKDKKSLVFIKKAKHD